MVTTVLFHHIPKTAGTTVRKYLQAHLQDQQEFIHLTNKGHKIAQQQGLAEFKDRSLTDRNRAKIIFGHDVTIHTPELITNPHVFAVVFREPQSWLISRYNQNMNRLHKHQQATVSFVEWIKHKQMTISQFNLFIKKFRQVQSVTDKEAELQATLALFDHVYVSDQVPKIIREIGGLLQVPFAIPENRNVVGVDKINFFQHSDEELATLERCTAEDVEIFNHMIKPLTL